LKLLDKLKKYLLRPLVHSYFFIGFCSSALYWATKVQLDQAFHINKDVLFIFFSTILIYIFNRLFANIDPVNSAKDFFMLVLQKNDNRITRTYIISLLAIIIYLCFYLQTSILQLFVFAGIISFAYMLPILKINKNRGGLRTLGLLKINLVAFVWSIVTVSVVALETNIDLLSKRHLVLFFERYIFIFVLTIPFDIRDKFIDKSRGMNTIPVVLGIGNTKLVNYSMLLLWLIFTVMQHGLLNIYTLVIFHIIIIIAALTYFTKEQRGDLYYLLIIDGMMIYYSICLFLVRLC